MTSSYTFLPCFRCDLLWSVTHYPGNTRLTDAMSVAAAGSSPPGNLNTPPDGFMLDRGGSSRPEAAGLTLTEYRHKGRQGVSDHGNFKTRGNQRLGEVSHARCAGRCVAGTTSGC